MRAIVFSTFALLSLLQPAISAPSTPAKSPARTGTGSAAPAAGTAQEAGDLTKAVEDLKASASAFQTAADATRWQECWKNLKTVISYCAIKHTDPGPVIKGISAINDLGVVYADSGNVKVWSFPKVSESDQMIVLWQDAVAGPATVVRGRSGRVLRRAAPPVVVTRVGLISCPAGASVSSARLVARSQPSANASSGKSASPGRSEGKGLILLGLDRKSGSVWLTGFQLSEGRWVSCPEIFSGVPPFLIQNLQGKVSFSGNNLVIQLETPRPANAQSESDAEKSNGGGYKINLLFLGDHYALDSKNGLDPATTVAMQFVQALQAGRMDLVKAWLVDPKLASIPGYLGLYSRGSSAPAFKLVPMVTPATSGVARFRLVTFDRDDLIMDVGKLKAQWAVKGLFIAPSDPLAKKIAM
jgi:hypothetical protein